MPNTIARPTPTSNTGTRTAYVPLLREGARGQSVTDVQHLLNAHGAHLSEDGIFGPKTAAAVRTFQRAQGLSVDAVVGANTMAALRRSPPPADDFSTPRPSGPSLNGGPTGNADFEFYAAMVRRAGGEVCPNGQPTVLGLRNVTGASRQYDDQFVVLKPNGTVERFSGATHPGQRTSTMSPDVNRDGRGDVGTIRPGNYKVVPNGPHGGAPSFLVETLSGSGHIPGWRDTNHDGTYSADERARSEARGDTLSGILFHQGNASSPRSIGCQTLSSNDYQRFLHAVGGRSARFTYTLVQV